MKPAFLPDLKLLFLIILTGVCLCPVAPNATAAPPALDAGKDYQPTSSEFDAVGKAAVQLLQTRDAAWFATNMFVSTEDWQSLITTNLTVEEQERIKGYGKGASHNQQQLESG